MLALQVLEQPQIAALALDPIKSRILAELRTSGSAASLAARLGLPRQKVNYHLGLLEQHELVEPVEERQWGGITERRFVASAASYVVGPTALGPSAPDLAQTGDRVSASYLIALAARIVREVGELWRKARGNQKRLATLSLDTVVSFASPAARAAFTEDLTSTIAALVARYHDAECPGARPHRLIIASYPAPKVPNH